MKFLLPNYSCLQIRGYRSQSPVLSVLYPQLNLLNPTRKKNPWYATDRNRSAPKKKPPLSSIEGRMVHTACVTFWGR